MKTIEWPPGSGATAEYAPHELAVLRGIKAKAEAGEIPARQAKNEIDWIHGLKVMLDARITGEEAADQKPVTLRSPHTLHRATDPETSAIAARKQSKRGTHYLAILRVYAAHEDLTDVEAAELAGLERVEATRRASELRNDELIEPVMIAGEMVTRLLPTNRPGMVCRITDAGRQVAAERSAA